MPTRTAHARWEGNLKQGKGQFLGDFYGTGLTSHPTNDQAGIEEKSGASVRA